MGQRRNRFDGWFIFQPEKFRRGNGVGTHRVLRDILRIFVL